MSFRSESNWNWLPVLGLPIIVPFLLCLETYALHIKMPGWAGYAIVGLGALTGAAFLLRLFGRRYWPMALAYLLAFFPVTLFLGLWLAAIIWKDAL